MPTISFGDERRWTDLVWLAVANSFAMDFLVRMKVSLAMTYTILDSMPFPRVTDRTHADATFLVPRVTRLICTAPEMLPFLNKMAAGGWVARHASESGVPGTTDEGERRQLQAEVDAYVARDVYGLTRDELAYVLDTFPIVEKRDMKEFGEYRTRLMILGAFNELESPSQNRSARRFTTAEEDHA